MIEERAVDVAGYLVGRGFVDTKPEHPWNMVSCEKTIGSSTMLVWGRHWSHIYVQIFQDDAPYDNMIVLGEAEDLESVAKLVDLAEEFLTKLAVVQPSQRTV